MTHLSRDYRGRTATCAALLTVCSSALTGPTFAGMVVYKDDQQGWANAAGSSDSIDFVLGSIQTLSNQYADLGVFFTGGDDFAKPAGAYVTDGWGAYTNTFSPPTIEIEFDIPRLAFAAQYPGARGFWLFSGGQVVYQGTYSNGSPSSFLGVISDVPIDEVWLISGIGPPAFDNVFVGHAPVPAPPMVVLAVAAMWGPRRRRSASSVE